MLLTRRYFCRHVYKFLLGRRVTFADYVYYDPVQHDILTRMVRESAHCESACLDDTDLGMTCAPHTPPRRARTGRGQQLLTSSRRTQSCPLPRAPLRRARRSDASPLAPPAARCVCSWEMAGIKGEQGDLGPSRSRNATKTKQNHLPSRVLCTCWCSTHSSLHAIGESDVSHG